MPNEEHIEMDADKHLAALAHDTLKNQYGQYIMELVDEHKLNS